jgi:YVTN family beta-propeller protein
MNSLTLGLLVSLISCGTALAADAPYHLAKSIPLGAGERWDYATFDPASGRVYVAHGDHVTVVDPSSGSTVGQIAGLPGGSHGIGISTANGLGFTDDGKAGTVAAFDLKTLQIVKQLPAATDADGIIADPVTGRIFVINGDSGSITVIDPKANSVLKTITIGAGLEAAVADGKGKLFVDGADAHDIIAIDTATMAVLAHYPMPDCERPHGIAVDAQTRRVFATCVNKVMKVLDADDGKIIATLPIGMGSDGAAFDPVRKLALSSNGDGTLTVVKERSANDFAVLANVPTERSARTIAIDEATGRVFLPAADIAKIDPPTTPGGRPHVTFVSGSMKLLVLTPQS